MNDVASNLLYHPLRVWILHGHVFLGVFSFVHALKSFHALLVFATNLDFTSTACLPNIIFIGTLLVIHHSSIPHLEVSDGLYQFRFNPFLRAFGSTHRVNFLSFYPSVAKFQSGPSLSLILEFNYALIYAYVYLILSLPNLI